MFGLISKLWKRKQTKVYSNTAERLPCYHALMALKAAKEIETRESNYRPNNPFQL